jgi:hypothetical protein
MRIPNFLPALSAIISITQAASLSPRMYNLAPGIGLISTDSKTYKLLDPRVKVQSSSILISSILIDRLRANKMGNCYLELALSKIDAGMS